MFDSRIRLPLAAALSALAAFAVVPALAVAQPAAGASARPDPLDAAAAVPDARYRSAFADYHRLGDEQVGSWRSANETVERAGGWKAYAREAAQPDEPTGRDAPAGEGASPGGHGTRGGQR